MLDTFTSAMCAETWGRIGFARALIEVTAEKELKQEVTMAVPIVEGDGHTRERIILNMTLMNMKSGKVKLGGICGERRRIYVKDKENDMILKGVEEWMDKDVVDVVVMAQTDQAISCKVDTFDLIKQLSVEILNVALNMEDISTGSSSMNSAMCDFKDCVRSIEVMDIHSTGLHFTWNQKPRGRNGVLKKLDRIMGNLEFIDTYQGAYAVFQPYRISDHTPSVCVFLEVLNTHWNISVAGHSMFQVTQKLKILKKPLRKLMHDQGNLHDKVNRLRFELDEVQKALDGDPSNSSLRDEEAVYVQAFNEAKIDEDRFLRQKAKIEWLEGGDSNTSYFHKSIKSRNQRSRIDVVTNAENVEVTGLGVPDVFVSHYEAFIGSSMECDLLNTTGLINKKVSDGSNTNMIEDRLIYAELEISYVVRYRIVFILLWDVESASVIGELPVINEAFVVKWRDTNGTMTDFTVKCAGKRSKIREGMKAPSVYIGLFTACYSPRHAFQLCLIHYEHLLFLNDRIRLKCEFNCGLWGMDVVPPVLENIIAWFQPLANKRTVQNIVGKILIAAATYFIWLERNNRLFKRTRRSPEDLRDAIVITVRLKLVSFRFKNKEKVRNFLSLWKMPTAFRFYGKVV
ncbi:hypothetical protein Tco_0013043 [Tanacetum coccineum]